MVIGHVITKSHRLPCTEDKWVVPDFATRDICIVDSFWQQSCFHTHEHVIHRSFQWTIMHVKKCIKYIKAQIMYISCGLEQLIACHTFRKECIYSSVPDIVMIRNNTRVCVYHWSYKCIYSSVPDIVMIRNNTRVCVYHWSYKCERMLKFRPCTIFFSL